MESWVGKTLPLRVTAKQRELIAIILPLALGLILQLPLLATPGHSDMVYYVKWTVRMLDDGPGSAYAGRINRIVDGASVTIPRSDNPVGQLTVFYVLGRWLYPALGGGKFPDSLIHSLNSPAGERARMVFKLPAVLANLTAAALIGCWIARRFGHWHGGLVTLMLACHPAFIHNAACWGQIDAWHSLGVVASALFLANRRPVAAIVALTAAMLFKFQAVACLPVIVAGLYRIAESPTSIGRTALRGGAVALGGILVAWLPFVVTGAGWDILSPYSRTVGQYPYTTVNAFNVHWLLADWSAVPASDFMPGGDDRDMVFTVPGVSFAINHRTAGLLAFAAITLLVCRSLLRGRSEPAEPILLAFVISCLGFFLFCTEMHERYLYPAIGLTAAAYQPTWRWWVIWGTISAGVSINMACFFAPAIWPTDWVQQNIESIGDTTAIGLIAALAGLLVVQRLSTRLPAQRTVLGNCA